MNSLRSQAAPPIPLRVVVGGQGHPGASSFAASVQDLGHVTCYRASIPELLRVVIAQEFDVAVVFVDALDQGGSLLRWFCARRPSTQLALCCPKSIGEQLRALRGEHAQVQVWDELSLHEQLANLGDMEPRSGLVGRFLEIELVDYVQILGLNGGDKLVRVSSALGSGYVWFERGQIVHAEYGEQTGEDAFYSLCVAGFGSFCEVQYRPPSQHSVQNSSTYLLMEASRRKDEELLSVAHVGRHPLDAELYDPMHALELDQETYGEGQPSIQELASANDAKAPQSVQVAATSINTPDELVVYCNAQAGVIQASAIHLQDLPAKGSDELLAWSAFMLERLYQHEAGDLRSLVCARQGKTHFVLIRLNEGAVALQLVGTQDPYDVRDELLDLVG